jgi:short-subunit dehydrogenase
MKKRYWEENVVIITGASSGIGQELALQLSDNGAWLALAARNKAKLEEIAGECIRRGARAIVVPTNISEKDQCRSLIDRTIEAFGRIDTLINNAGIAGASRFDEYQDLAVFEKIIQVNFMGTVYCTHYALLHLKETHGRLVGISSIGGKCPKAVADGYTPSKYAVAGFLDSLRLELANSGVSVTAIFPGWVNTGITARSLMADGKLKGKVSDIDSGGMPVEKCAQLIIKAAVKRKREVIMPVWYKSLPWLNRNAPRLFDIISLRLSDLK